MTKRRTIQIISVAAAAFVALGAVTISGYVLSANYERNLEYTYRRAFNDLSTYVTTMESTLEKAAYANTATQQNGITAKLIKEASGAKSSLSALPLREDTMDNVNKFITQVEDFSTSLSKKISMGKGISEDDQETLDKLYDYAALLKADLAQLQNQFDNQDLKIGESTALLANLTLEEAIPTFGDELAAYAEDFKDYPTLIYDGPFSDHITQMEPKLIKDAETVSVADAIETASKFFDIEKNDLSHTSDTGGNLPTYNLTYGDKIISVTQQGGQVLSLLDTRTIESANLTYEDAKKKAEEFLQKNNFGDMQESYYVINDNKCTIQFFSKVDDATVYPDLIKVSVALDNGDITEYNASGYIMNHHERELDSPALSLEKARKQVSPNLEIEKENLAIIPTAGLDEVLCYEFLCKGKNEEEVLVYINADTGFEEQILILLRSDNGVLTI